MNIFKRLFCSVAFTMSYLSYFLNLLIITNLLSYWSHYQILNDHSIIEVKLYCFIEFAKICQSSTEFHFDSLSDQLISIKNVAEKYEKTNSDR